MPRDAVPTVAELEARIDEAVVIARASEEGVREVGELAIDAATQARRAAEAAEESASAAQAAASKVSEPAGPVTAGDRPAPALEWAQVDVAAAEEEEPQEAPVRFDERFRRFSERAERLSGRLRRLCELEPGPSVGAGRRRGDG